MTTKQAWRVFRGAAYSGMIAAVFLCSQRRMVVAAAGAADLCVTMSGGNGQVGGLQIDLTWDPACMTAQRAQGNAAQCTANAATGKSVQTSLMSDSLMRVLFLSMSDQSPISDGQLFCCRFTMATAQGNPCCSVNTGNMILADARGVRLYVTDLPDISVEAQVSGVSCSASVPGGSPGNPVRPPLPAVPIVQPPVVSAPAAPAAPAPGALAPVMPRPNVPAEAPPVEGLTAEAPTPAPTEPEPSPAVTTAAVGTSTAARTPTARTPTSPAATPPERTPQVQGTPTGSAPSVTAPAPSASQPATTPTPKRKEQRHKKRPHASQG